MGSEKQKVKPSKDHKQSITNESHHQTVVKSNKKLKAVVYIFSVILMVLFLVFGMFVGVFFHYYSLMDINDSDEENAYSNVAPITNSDLDVVPGNSVKLSDEKMHSDSDVMNILLIGTDERTEKFDPYARADSIMVLSLNKKTHAVKLISLERGMTVQMPGGRCDLLTHTFHYGGSKLVIETVRTHFLLDTERYIRVNFSVFEKLIDQLGGVDITLSAEEANALNKKLTKKVSEGKNHLDGKSALHYARLRSIDSDWHRIKRQRNVIASIKNSMKGQSVSELNDLANTCLPYVQTNLTSLEFGNLLLNLSQYANGEFKEMTIPKKGTFKGLGDVDFEANSRILREFIYD